MVIGVVAFFWILSLAFTFWAAFNLGKAFNYDSEDDMY